MLAIRNGYINIYYRGGNILRLTKRSKCYRTFFDEQYDKSRQNFPNSPATISNQDDAQKWVDSFSCRKNIMDQYLSDYGKAEPEFGSERFVFDGVKDVYVCPVGKELSFWKGSFKGKPECGRCYRTVSCACCASRSRCTRNRRGRIMVRWGYQDAVDRLRARLESSVGKEKLRLRRLLVEHPFGTMKRLLIRVICS